MEPKKEVATKKDLERVERTLGEKIEENGRKLDKLLIQVIKNSEVINEMVTKEEFNQFRHDVLSGQDKMMTILTRLDQERIFTTEWIRRIEGDVERNKGEIKRIKERLAIA